MMIQRMLTVVGAALAALMLTSTAAFAHICYNASRSDTGNQNAVRGQALSSGAEFLGALYFFGCDDEADALAAAFAADDLDPANVLVNEKTTMAQGLLPDDPSGDPSPLSLNGKGIDHLLPYLEEIEAAVDCLEENAPG